MINTENLKQIDGHMQSVSQYIGDLRSQTGYYLDWIPNWYADLPEQNNFYEVIRKDEEICRCSNLLALMVSGDRVRVKAANKFLHDITLFALSEIRDFQHARKSLVEKTAVFGLGIQKKFYEKVEYSGLEWKVCTRLQEVDRRRLRIEKVSGTQRQYWTIWHPQYDKYIVLDDLNINPQAEYSLQDYAWYINNWEELSPYFEGFGDTLYRLAYIKNNCIKYWADLAESWSGPHLIAKIDMVKKAVSDAQNTGLTTQEERVRKLTEELEKQKARHLLIADENDDIKFFEHGNSGSNIIKELMTYCDNKINRLFFGTETAVDAGGGRGSYALARVHRGATESIVQYHRSRLEEVLTREIIFDFFWRNQNNFRQLGIPYPRWNDIKIEILANSEEEMKDAERQKGGGGGGFGGKPQ